MLATPAIARSKTSSIVARDRLRYAGQVGPTAPQLTARALLALFCRDDVLEQRMSPEVREILGILSRSAGVQRTH